MPRATSHHTHEVSHGFHFLMTCLTGGLWGIVWISVCVATPFRRKRTITRY
jgi:hypothetical protein